jgi:hypothetical protein
MHHATQDALKLRGFLRRIRNRCGWRGILPARPGQPAKDPSPFQFATGNFPRSRRFHGPSIEIIVRGSSRSISTC